MEAVSDKQQIILTAQERKRLADYLDVLIEMHFEYKRNHKRGNKDATRDAENNKDKVEVLLDF